MATEVVQHFITNTVVRHSDLVFVVTDRGKLFNAGLVDAAVQPSSYCLGKSTAYALQRTGPLSA